jgi:6-phosphofructokinase 1
MGRDAGHLAVAVGVAAGAEVTLVPEVATTTAEVSNALQRAQALGKLSCIVVVAEGWGQGAQVLAADLIRDTGYDIRVAILGHVQRGGPPTALDRVLASQFGARAVDVLNAGERAALIATRGGDLVTTDLAAAWQVRPALRSDLFTLSRRLAGVWPPTEEGPLDEASAEG